MAVAWYGAKVWKATSPDGTQTIIGTRPTHLWTWEMWTVTKDDGTTIQVPQRLRHKYQCPITLAYDKDYVEGDDSTMPTVALLRVEYPDTGTSPIEPADVILTLDTKTKWDNAMAQYPSLKARFTDQPYYPAV